VGRRDRAVLLLLARLGLRAGDIVRVRLSDVDLKTASIQVCGKGRRHTRLPLTREVGQAIVAYLKKGRRGPMPMRCLSVAARRFAPSKVLLPFPISSTRPCAALVWCAPFEAPRICCDISLATSMLWQGASLEDIGAVLRHSSAETTQIYAKVDIPTSRFLPEKLRCILQGEKAALHLNPSASGCRPRSWQ